MAFATLPLDEPLLRALRAEGYATPTPIQAQAIPHLVEGRDLLGCAQTGTGKTAAFALPILQRLTHHRPRRAQAIRVLVLAPTRELAAQIAESFAAYGRHTPHRAAVIFGGVGQHGQEQALRRHPAILVATPGRLLDLMGQGIVRLDALEVFVLDEADRMLDMGFINDIRKVCAAVPRERQTLMFSATMPSAIRDLAHGLLKDPVRVDVAPVSSAAETVVQRAYYVAKPDKPLLLKHLLSDNAVGRALVFTRTKHGADKVARHLENAGIPAQAIHGNKSQNARQRALEGFRRGAVRVLVASDIASRGIDVDAITHVVNYDVPNEPETYVHRIGRTGRAGASGMAWSLVDAEERGYLRDIERLIRAEIPVVADHPYPASQSARRHPQPPQHQQQRHNNHAGRGHRGHTPQAPHAPHAARAPAAHASDAAPARTGGEPAVPARSSAVPARPRFGSAGRGGRRTQW